MATTGPLKTQIPWRRIGAEFLAITVAVYLGLLADNYREQRLEDLREQEYLRLLAADLDSDLDTLDYTRRGIFAQATAAQRIHHALGGKAVSQVDVEKAFAALILTWTYEQQRPTYLALRGGLGLHIITDHDIRLAVTNYYEVDQLRLKQDYLENYLVAQSRLRVHFNNHIKFIPPDEFDSFAEVPDDFHVVRLHSAIEEMAGDIAFANDLAEVGGRGFEMIGEIDRVKAANRSVHAVLVDTSN